MARMAYFVDFLDGTTRKYTKADYDGMARTPRVFDAELGWVRATRVVEMKSNPSRHICDSRCVHATGRVMKCECACGGANHGKGAGLPV